MINSTQKNNFIYRDRTAIVVWLCLCALLVASMVFVGGYTRLSGSGLSITEWKPIHGVIPPLNMEEWQEEFAAYQASPQYQKINKGMSLEAFKTIFWPEFFHRLLGRAIGMVFLFPLLVFAIRKSISKSFGLRLTAIFALGGLQGVIGWFMVASGLVDNPHVSHLRLALHLSVAFAIYGLLVWAIKDAMRCPEDKHGHVPLGYLAWIDLLCAQIILGAMVAGLHAGLVYNTWPTMNGQWFPGDLLSELAWYENPVLVQFIHRNVALMVAFSFILWWFSARFYVKNKSLCGLCAAVTSVIAIQFILGVLTLLHMVPLSLALAHQMMALVLFTLAVLLWHGMRWNKND